MRLVGYLAAIPGGYGRGRFKFNFRPVSARQGAFSIQWARHSEPLENNNAEVREAAIICQTVAWTTLIWIISEEAQIKLLLQALCMNHIERHRTFGRPLTNASVCRWGLL